MKLLGWTAVTALALGIAVAVIAGLTWPEWNAAAEYGKYLKAAEFAGVESPDSAAGFINPPSDLYTGHWIAVSIGSVVVGWGLLLSALWLHARAVTS